MPVAMTDPATFTIGTEKVVVDLDAITNRQANALIDRMLDASPEVVGATIEMTLWASPTAGPVRILRESAD